VEQQRGRVAALVSGAAAGMADWQWTQSGSWSRHEAGCGVLAEKQQVVALGSGCEGKKKGLGIGMDGSC
jgi:hypothetical protein